MSDMKYGLNLLVYTAAFTADQVDLIPKVAEMGYDGVEVPFNDLSLLDAAATRRACEAAGQQTAGARLLPRGFARVHIADAAGQLPSLRRGDASEARPGPQRSGDYPPLPSAASRVAGATRSPAGMRVNLAYAVP